MVKILLLEDDSTIRNQYKKIIQSDLPEACITAISSETEFKKLESRYDIGIIDLELPDTDGVEFIKKFEKRFRCFIILTSHSERMQDCFARKVTGFVTKDTSMLRFRKTLKQAVLELREDLKISFISNGSSITVRISEILWIQTSLRKIQICLSDGMKYEISQSTVDYFEKITSPFLLKIDRSTLINPIHVRSWNQNGPIILLNGECFYPSRRKAKQIYGKYLETL